MVLKHLFIQFPVYNLSSGRFLEVKNKSKFQNFSFKSGHGRLEQVSNILIWLGNFRILENWSLKRGGLLREVVVIGGSTVLIQEL